MLVPRLALECLVDRFHGISWVVLLGEMLLVSG